MHTKKGGKGALKWLQGFSQVVAFKIVNLFIGR